MKQYNLDIELHRAKGNNVMYMLLPMKPNSELMDTEAVRFGVNIAVITGMYWDDDLTPWPAPGEPPGDPAFKGLSSSFLSYLITNVLPSVEKELSLDNPERTLCRISLSGLFAVWARTRTAVFHNIISISGSFWYKDFVDWLKTADFPPLPSVDDKLKQMGKIYLSLGKNEPESPVVAFRSVGTGTTSVVDTLRHAGFDVTFRMVPGNHYQHFEPRLILAITDIFGTN